MDGFYVFGGYGTGREPSGTRKSFTYLKLRVTSVATSHSGFVYGDLQVYQRQDRMVGGRFGFLLIRGLLELHGKCCTPKPEGENCLFFAASLARNFKLVAETLLQCK